VATRSRPNAALAIATVSETVNVSAEARVIESGRQVGVNVTPEEVQSLPVNGGTSRTS